MLREHSFLLYFWLCWVFAALRVLLELGARRLLIAVASLLQSVGSRVWGLQYLQCMASVAGAPRVCAQAIEWQFLS